MSSSDHSWGSDGASPSRLGFDNLGDNGEGDSWEGDAPSEPRGGWSFQPRGYERTAVLLPGWATDTRIFSPLELPFNLITPHRLITRDIDSLAVYLPTIGCDRVLLIGWSLGGFAAMNFARRFPHLVAHQVLIGIRRHYPDDQLGEIDEALRDDPPRCLTGFYRQCFLPAQRKDYRWFRAALEPAYLRDFYEHELHDGLYALAEAEVMSDMLTCCPTTIIHGEQDIIAPAAEARELAAQTGTPFHLLPNTGHAAFLSDEFTGCTGWI